MHKSACLVACQIGKEGKQKTKNEKGVGDEKRDRDREDCGAVISERVSSSLSVAVSPNRERVLVNWEYDLQICLYVALLSCCWCVAL